MSILWGAFRFCRDRLGRPAAVEQPASSPPLPPAGVEPAPRVPPAGPDLHYAAGVVRAYAALAPELYDQERTDLRALADRLTAATE